MLKDLPIEKTNLRLQCEQQIKGRLIRIRQAYLEIGLRRNDSSRLLKESLRALLPIFRGLLRLKTTQEPAVDKREIINSMAKNFGIDSSVFMSVLLDSRNNEQVFEKYIREVERIAIAVDQLKINDK